MKLVIVRYISQKFKKKHFFLNVSDFENKLL